MATLRFTIPEKSRSTPVGCPRMWAVTRHPTPGMLTSHRCLAALPDGAPAAWPFQVDGNVQLLPIEPALRANDMGTIERATLSGLGIAHLRLHVVYPHSRRLAPAVSEFVSVAVDEANGTGLQPE